MFKILRGLIVQLHVEQALCTVLAILHILGVSLDGQFVILESFLSVVSKLVTLSKAIINDRVLNAVTFLSLQEVLNSIVHLAVFKLCSGKPQSSGQPALTIVFALLLRFFDTELNGTFECFNRTFKVLPRSNFIMSVGHPLLLINRQVSDATLQLHIHQLLEISFLFLGFNDFLIVLDRFCVVENLS